MMLANVVVCDAHRCITIEHAVRGWRFLVAAMWLSAASVAVWRYWR
jgi:hypothetical protein